jgi:hypothetical protein
VAIKSYQGDQDTSSSHSSSLSPPRQQPPGTARQQPPFLHTPLMLADDAKRVAVPAFWAYLLADGIVSLGAALLDSSLMPVVFDLDETLLQASSISQLKNRIDAANKIK